MIFIRQFKLATALILSPLVIFPNVERPQTVKTSQTAVTVKMTNCQHNLNCKNCANLSNSKFAKKTITVKNALTLKQIGDRYGLPESVAHKYKLRVTQRGVPTQALGWPYGKVCVCLSRPWAQNGSN